MQKEISQFIKDTLKLEESPSVEIPTQAGFGHYSSNVGLVEAKKEGKSSAELAKNFIANLKEADKQEKFAEIESAGPGFINFTLKKEFIRTRLSKLNIEEKLSIGKGEKVVLEFISPNIAKPMHVGHGRNAIIGESIARILEFLNYEVLRWNYFGNWGTQFGKLIAAYKKPGNKELVAANPIEGSLAIYTRFHDELKEDKSLEEQGRTEFKKLVDGDRENLKIWKLLTEISLQEFRKTFKKLGIQFDVERGERDYDASTKELIKELLEKGIAHQSKGAIVVNLENENLPTALLQKADGVSVYLTREIELLKERIQKYKAKKILIVTGNEQTLHFQQLEAIAKKLGLLQGIDFRHIKYGLVLNEEGKKFATRSGKLIRLEELLSEAISKAKAIVEKKNPDLSKEEKEKVAKVVGLGALKYFDLKERRTQDITFNWKQMLDFNGNSGPYLQYSYARLKSILAKEKAPSKAHTDKLEEELELELIKKLLDFKDIISLCAQSYITSHLATYLHQLAKLANRYYEEVRILDDEKKQRKEARLFLLQKISQTLKQGLSLLGIQVLEQI